MRVRALVLALKSGCGATREVEPSGSETLTRQAVDAGFAISGVMLEAHGLCADCSAA